MNAPSNPKMIATADIDVSNASIFQDDTWPAYFAKLRAEDPIHYTENELFGGFWSVTRYEDIVAVDSNHEAFSSEPAITIGDYGDDVPVEQFIFSRNSMVSFIDFIFLKDFPLTKTFFSI